MHIYLKPNFLSDIASELRKASRIPAMAVPVSNFVDSCLNDVTIPGIYLLANNGGYIYFYERALMAENEQIAYHLEFGNDVSPSKEFMENELSRFIRDSLKICTDNFNEFKGYNISGGEVSAEADIANNWVFVRVNYLLIVKREDAEVRISDFTTTIPIRLGSILSMKDKIVENIKNKDYIDLDYLSSQELEITLLPYDKQNLVYSLYDNKSNVNDAPFIFNFAVKVQGNSPPELELIPDFVLTKGKSFVYDINATDMDGDALRYFSDFALVDVNMATGVLIFTPPVLGNYSIKVCVQDTYLAEDCENIKFMIKDE